MDRCTPNLFFRARSAGGVKLSSGSRRITLDNTLDERLRLLEDRVGDCEHSRPSYDLSPDVLPRIRCFPKLGMTFSDQMRTGNSSRRGDEIGGRLPEDFKKCIRSHNISCRITYMGDVRSYPLHRSNKDLLRRRHRDRRQTVQRTSTLYLLTVVDSERGSLFSSSASSSCGQKRRFPNIGQCQPMSVPEASCSSGR